jgi:acetoin utilization deacetylase AcuC-like enzyme
LPPGCAEAAFIAAVAEAVETVGAFRPDVVVVSLGVDPSALDPIGDLGATANGFRRCGEMVAALGVPTIVVQEGGYHVPTVGVDVRAWLDGLLSA